MSTTITIKIPTVFSKKTCATLALCTSAISVGNFCTGNESLPDYLNGDAKEKKLDTTLKSVAKSSNQPTKMHRNKSHRIATAKSRTPILPHKLKAKYPRREQIATAEAKKEHYLELANTCANPISAFPKMNTSELFQNQKATELPTSLKNSNITAVIDGNNAISSFVSEVNAATEDETKNMISAIHTLASNAIAKNVTGKMIGDIKTPASNPSVEICEVSQKEHVLNVTISLNVSVKYTYEIN